MSCCSFKICSTSTPFVRVCNCYSDIGKVAVLESFGSSGSLKSIVGSALVDKSGNPSKRKAAQVP